MRRLFLVAAVGTAVLLIDAAPAEPACCYFSALEKDVNQPGQKAFLTWDPVEKVESFTVQPMFEGNAKDFGMVVPTPSQPKLSEVDRDFFKSLAVFTILKPMDVKKFKQRWRMKRKGGLGGGPTTGGGGPPRPEASVKVLESGVVGSLDYKIIEATKADDLFIWLKHHHYHYTGDAKTLDHYIEKRWYFTVMKIDPKQMKRKPDGSYRGEVTPTRFTFESDRLVYPLRITQISVKDRTDALFYIQAPEKMDLPERFSYQLSFQSMWSNAYGFANWELCNQAEKDWWKVVKDQPGPLAKEVAAWKKANPGSILSTLEWSRKLTAADLRMLRGEAKFDREAPAADIKKLAKLSGILREGRFVTKCRHVFLKSEMTEDLVFVPARYKGKKDTVEHIQILPTSPP